VGVNIPYHSTIVKRFGLHKAMSAMKLLLKDIPDNTLNIHGRYENNFREKLEKIFEELELNDKVTRE